MVLDVAGARDLPEVEAHRTRLEWANRFGKETQARYARIFSLSAGDVQVAFRRCVALLPRGVSFRAWLWRVALGPEALWHLRQSFAASLAVVSAASYVLGIGDRHLDNYLLSIDTAEVVPIDFGYSFGIGALLPVPEMLPFRLTGFLVSAMQPLAGATVRGTFHHSLATALARWRASRSVLLDVCAIFVREPLLDWTAESKRRGLGGDVEFLPRRRLALVDARLRGQHPAKVLHSELSDNPFTWVKALMRDWGKPGGLESMIAGVEDARRAEIYRAGRELTPSEQSDCLILQATDANLLGRAWQMWAPEI